MALLRNNYFVGDILNVADFTTEQRYFENLLQLHQRHLHTWGIAEGLTIEVRDESSLLVQPGLAIDHLGRTLVLSGTSSIDLQDRSDETISIGLEYHEQESDFSPGDVPGFHRWQMIPRVICLPEPVQPTALILGEVTVGAHGMVKDVKESVRRYVGMRLGELTFIGSSRDSCPVAAISAVYDDPLLSLSVKAKTIQISGGLKTGEELCIGTRSPQAALDILSSERNACLIFAERQTLALSICQPSSSLEIAMGIGTDNPRSRLELMGGGLHFNAPVSSDPMIYFAGNGEVRDSNGGMVRLLPDQNLLQVCSSGEIKFSFGGSATEAMQKVVLDGHVGVRVNEPEQPLTVMGIIESKEMGFIFPDGSVQAQAAVTFPIGTILNWWHPGPDAEAAYYRLVPDGFVICRGQIVDDELSPFYKARLPDFGPGQKKFILGTGDPGLVNTQKGSELHTHLFTLLSHSHPIPHKHWTSGATGVTSSTVDLISDKHWELSHSSLSDHTHAYNLETSDPNTGKETHSTVYVDKGGQVVTEVTTTAASAKPLCLYLLKIMRIK